MNRRYRFLSSVLAIVILLAGCGRDFGDLAERMARLSGADEPTPDRIAELERDIRQSRRDLEGILEKQQELGRLHKLLGLKYMDYDMYGEALESFRSAADLYPGEAGLLYYRGLAAARFGKTRETAAETADYLNRAERSYRQAITADPRYTPSYYALAILYIYELDRASEAGTLLDRFLEIERSHVRALFLRAQLYEREGDPRSALDTYDRILQVARNEDEKARAREMREELLAGGNGG